MSPSTLFYILIGIIIIKFLFDTYIDALNAKHFNDEIPKELDEVYNYDEYEKSQAYKKEILNIFNSTFFIGIISNI